MSKVDEEINELRNSVLEIWSFIKENTAVTKDVVKIHSLEIKDLKSELCKIKSEVDKVISAVSECEKSLNKIKKVTEQKLSVQEKRVRVKLEKQNEEIQKIVRKNKPYGKNIVLHGIKKGNQATDVQWFKEFCKEKLNVEPIIENGVIKRARAGHFVGIFTLKSSQEKAKIFRKCFMLKSLDYKISVRDDLYEETVQGQPSGLTSIASIMGRNKGFSQAKRIEADTSGTDSNEE